MAVNQIHMHFNPAYTNLVSLFQNSIDNYGERPAFGVKREGQWHWITYSEFGKLVDQLRSSLDGLGVKPGDRVAVISDNRLEWAVGAYATLTLGAAYVPMYETQQEKEWKYILGDCGAKVCFVANEQIRSKVHAFMDSLDSLRFVIDFESDASVAGSYAQLVKNGAAKLVPRFKPVDGDIAGFIYTSGTTGDPKGVKLSHLNLASNVSGMQQLIPFTAEDRTLAFLPWAHVFGWNVELNGMLSIGAAMAICEGNDKIISNLAETRPSVLFAVPRIWNRIYDGVQKQMASKPPLIRSLFKRGMAAAAKQRAGARLSVGERFALVLARRLIFAKIVAKFGGRLRYAVSGAAALSREVAEFVDNLGVRVYEGYGMTETSPIIACNHPGAVRIGTVGRALPGVLIRLDHEAAGGDAESGEIIVKGPGVMQGYHNLAEETKQAMTADGGLRTGDLGSIDRDGYLRITGRVKELYKLENGKYVAPAPLEEKLVLSPYIAQVMVFGADRPFNVALIVPDITILKEWADRNGVACKTTDALLNDERTLRLFQGELDSYGRDFKAFERIRKFKLIAEEFSTKNDLLTPTLKMKRRNVLKRYDLELQGLWT